MTSPLDDAEMAQWIAWKRANDTVTAAVSNEIHAASALSVPDFSILSRVIENGGGRMPQQELGLMLDWQRARLSRQLSRMAERGLVTREDGPAGRRVIIATADGRSALAAARPAHARAVRRALLSHTASHRADFWSAVHAIADPPTDRP
ncbi:MarR family transcriptional regulator [Streptomyces sp. SID14478]|uniref:MarR family transcriptional regulator n=1 Tax=Streptomyces sp. SID14478 TaxID=2706073 RepID=UPI0013DD0110|nr:helix-turn-helix domain-containing protein [Streptomyces sp. SID14478]NEB74692.1 MarR family transcriptional regulator [Streptomyces sp. SID14478]